MYCEEQARAWAQEHLAGWGLTVEQLAAEVPYTEDERALLLVGSIPEGLGSVLSDIDLLVIGPRQQAGDMVFGGQAFEEIVYRMPGGVELNIAFLDGKALDTLQRQLSSALVPAAPDSEPTARQLPMAAVRMAHKIRAGLCLRGDVNTLREELHTERLPDYVLLHNRVVYHVMREDVIGQLLSRHSDSAGLMLFYAMDAVATAVLASVGETNIDPKWKLRLLERSAPQLGDAAAAALRDCLQVARGADVNGAARRAFALADQVLGERLAARPDLEPVLAALDEHVKFVLDMEMIDKLDMATSA